MKPQNSAYKHDPNNGVYGDCHRACVASILELPIEEVEHFADNDPSALEFNNRIRKWCRDRGYVYASFAYSVDPREYMAMENKDIYYILGGKSSIGANHSVVCLNDKIVHDPSGTSIVDSTDNGYYYVEIIGAPQSWAKE